MIFNTVIDDSYSGDVGITEIYATINVSYPNGSICTCTDGEVVLKAATTNGEWIFPIPYAGEWTIKCTDGAYTDSMTVNITEYGQSKSVALEYAFEAIITIIYPANSSCVIKNNDGITIASDTNAGSSTKTWSAKVTEAGSYTVAATFSGSGVYTDKIINITSNGQSENVTLTYKTSREYFFKAGTGAVVSLYSGSSTNTEINDNSISFTMDGNNALVRPYSTTNLTNISTIYADVMFTEGHTNSSLQMGIIVFPETNGVGNGRPADVTQGPNQGVAYVYFPINSTRQTVKVDVTNLSDEYFIGLYGRSTGTVYNFYYDKLISG